MHHLQADEKLCPFCAEVIKAAAVKCRYCHSELPREELVAAGQGSSPPPAAAPAREDAPDPAADERPAAESGDSFHDVRAAGPGLLGSRVLTGVLVTALVLVAFVGVRLWWVQRADEHQVAQLIAVSDDHGDRAARALSEAEHGVVSSDEAKTAALVASTNAAQTVLSYSAPSLAKDKAAAESLLSPTVRKQYDATMASIEPATLKNQVKVQATVVAASIITATDHDAKALLFVNQTTTSKVLKVPRVDQNRVVVTLHRDGGEWTVTDLNAL